MHVIGTAGHVDHGKSTLVKRLTGIDPDRLSEEKARAMTIDLGFAWLNLSHGETLGIIDVPGHRDFIENMLAGVGSISAILLVVAADEGIMPQTREHLAILDLLGIENGLIVLTKTDLINDADWLDLVEQEVQEAVRSTTLAQAEIVRISAHSGAGMDNLLQAITALLADLPPTPNYNHPHLSIDRVFSVSGFGTVVTGTLLGGALRVGDEIEIQPTGLRGRIRGLQSYKQTIESASPGSRVAVNLAGVEKTALERGQVLTYPRHIQPTRLADVRFRHLPDASRPLKHNAEAKLFVGAAESTVHVRLLDAEILPPGAEGWVQLHLDQPMALTQGDRFILRYPSPGETIGGGIIVHPQPERRWKRFQSDIIQQLEIRMMGTPAERIAQAANQPEPIKRSSLQKLVGLDNHELDAAVEQAVQTGLLITLPDTTYLSALRWQALIHQLISELTAFHQAEPLRQGIGREQLRNQLGIKPALLNLLLDRQDKVIARGSIVWLANHSIHFNPAQQSAVDQLMQHMNAAPYAPPSYTDAALQVGENVLRALIDLGEIIQVQPDVIFTGAAYAEMVATLLRMLDQTGQITTAQVRDQFNTTRKYTIGLLEHLDTIGVTKRVGDARVRGTSSEL